MISEHDDNAEMIARLRSIIENVCRDARKASALFACTSTDERNALLSEIADRLERSRAEITEANRADLERGKSSGLTSAMLDRLELNEKRMTSMIQGVREVVALPDPVGETIREWTPSIGVCLQKVRVPIGVIGIVYESRPNVTIDAGVLCLKTGNVPVLRGGKEAYESNRFLVKIMSEAAEARRLPVGIAGFVPVTDREGVPLFCAMDAYVDLMIPRGGYGLIQTVVAHARMPVIKHYQGICHVYIHDEANPDMAERIVVNAKCQRPGVCNAMETLLIDRSIAHDMLPRLAAALRRHGVRLLGNADVGVILGETLDAPASWKEEYLDLILAIRVVDDMEAAIAHIESFGSRHTDTIVTENREAAEKFLKRVDSSVVFWNASTRLSDGGQFGFGAEIGISTEKIHARGPMALEELTIYKYLGRGTGQIRE